MNNTLCVSGVYRKHLHNSLKLLMKNILTSVQNQDISSFSIYISFDKNYPDIKFPEINFMEQGLYTIVLDERFWDLKVDQRGFSVCLEFEQQSEQIYIPFNSILLFTDTINDCLIDLRDINEFYKKLSDNSYIYDNEYIELDTEINENKIIYVDII